MRCVRLAGYWVLIACLALLFLPGVGWAADRRVALVIGNSAYRNAPRLDNPIKDAKAVAEMLKSAGFDSVELKLDLESLDLKRAVRAFLQTAENSDIAVLYFAGHGIEVNNANYVIPVDARLKTDFDAEDEGVALERIIRAVEPARRLRLVILDACRDNPFINTMQRTVGLRAITAGLGRVEPEASDTLVAFAARAGSVARDGERNHSPFTAALLKHLPTPGLDIRIAFGRVRDDVLKATDGKQEPFVYGSLGGSTISLVPDAAALARAAPPPPPRDLAADTRRDYEFAERIGTRQAWLHFLEAHPEGFLADLARTQLTRDPPSETADRKPDAPAKTAALDVSKPETRRPSLALPDVVAVKPPDPGPPLIAKPTTPVPIAPRGDACARDRERLTRLREEPVVAEIVKFSRDLGCEALRPQLTRLLESTADPAETAPATLPKAAALPPKASPPSPPSSAPTPTPSSTAAPPRPQSPPATVARLGPSSAACQQEGRTLERLRSAPDLKTVDTFARSMACAELKPQVLRLRESLQD